MMNQGPRLEDQLEIARQRVDGAADASVALAWTPEVKLPDVPVISESKEVRVAIEKDTDIVAARQTGRMLAAGLGFSSSDATIVATAISELARNIVVYAKRGEIILNAVTRDDRSAVIVTARDEGAGLADLSSAMKNGYSTSGRLGVGLSGVKRIMDEFDIRSDAGTGTMVTIVKWHRRGRQVG
jgi:serine/threonine-protein kinase RsbT